MHASLSAHREPWRRHGPAVRRGHHELRAARRRLSDPAAGTGRSPPGGTARAGGPDDRRRPARTRAAGLRPHQAGRGLPADRARHQLRPLRAGLRGQLRRHRHGVRGRAGGADRRRLLRRRLGARRRGRGARGERLRLSDGGDRAADREPVPLARLRLAGLQPAAQPGPHPPGDDRLGLRPRGGGHPATGRGTAGRGGGTGRLPRRRRLPGPFPSQGAPGYGAPVAPQPVAGYQTPVAPPAQPPAYGYPSQPPQAPPTA